MAFAVIDIEISLKSVWDGFVDGSYAVKSVSYPLNNWRVIELIDPFKSFIDKGASKLNLRGRDRLMK